MTEYGEQLKIEYEEVYTKYESFTKNISDLIKELLKNENIEYLPIEKRTKSIESFTRKIVSLEKIQKYKSHSDITDLSGIRIIAYLQEDRSKICGIIEKFLLVDYENSVKIDELLEADQFGYRSIHYVISYTPERIALPEFKKFSEMKAEIQVRTLLQHTWAAIDWKLRYKNEFEAPKEIRRKLYRISALLELADDEFSHLAQAVDNLRKSYQEKISRGNFDIEINRESIELFIRDDKTVSDLISLAQNSGHSISPPAPHTRNPYQNLLATLDFLKIHKIKELKSLLEKIVKEEGNVLTDVFSLWNSPGKPPKLVIDASGLVRVCTVFAMKKDPAKKVLSEHPFGPELQRAITEMIK